MPPEGRYLSSFQMADMDATDGDASSTMSGRVLRPVYVASSAADDASAGAISAVSMSTSLQSAGESAADSSLALSIPSARHLPPSARQKLVDSVLSAKSAVARMEAFLRRCDSQSSSLAGHGSVHDEYSIVEELRRLREREEITRRELEGLWLNGGVGGWEDGDVDSEDAKSEDRDNNDYDYDYDYDTFGSNEETDEDSLSLYSQGTMGSSSFASEMARGRSVARGRIPSSVNLVGQDSDEAGVDSRWRPEQLSSVERFESRSSPSSVTATTMTTMTTTTTTTTDMGLDLDTFSNDDVDGSFFESYGADAAAGPSFSAIEWRRPTRSRPHDGRVRDEICSRTIDGVDPQKSAQDSRDCTSQAAAPAKCFSGHFLCDEVDGRSARPQAALHLSPVGQLASVPNLSELDSFDKCKRVYLPSPPSPLSTEGSASSLTLVWTSQREGGLLLSPALSSLDDAFEENGQVRNDLWKKTSAASSMDVVQRSSRGDVRERKPMDDSAILGSPSLSLVGLFAFAELMAEALYGRGVDIDVGNKLGERLVQPQHILAVVALGVLILESIVV